MYSVAVVPILVGAGAAYAATGVMYFARCGQLLLGSVLVVAWLNLSNDAFDAETGADVSKAESVVALTGNRKAVLAAANVSLLGGVALLGRAVADSGDLRVGLVLAAAIFMGYLYQGPPFRLSYLGLGEPLCFLAFGPFATCAFYLAQVASGAPPGTTVLPMVSWPAMAASVIVGTTTAAVLFCSHFHQVASDRSAKKLSPVVRLGTDRAMQVLTGSVAWAVDLLMFGWRTHGDAAAVWPLKLYALSWHTAVGLALAAGLCLCRMPPPALPAFVLSARDQAVRLWQMNMRPLPKLPPPALAGPPAPQPPPPPPPPPLPAA
ncbi:hypothetical protein WJX81_005647 [Elliptochloris bilobata]|uniref:1,4-dihydroxy-2-naphthoate octaprenyltransferase n=1 Tax=Elliptochloris bilobata TaxID=381761 RepID=A0AAW1R284_9CHLO